MAALVGTVRTVWIQHAGPADYAQRHLPTGGAEIHWRHWRTGAPPTLLGPLTGARTEIIPAATTVIGVRFWPGALSLRGPNPRRPVAAAGLDEVVDQQIVLDGLWGPDAARLSDAARHDDAEQALARLQAHLVRAGCGTPRDPRIRAAVRSLMPWPTVAAGVHQATSEAGGSRSVGAVAEQVGLSASQLRRRCTQDVGVGPKVLQRMLRFQAFLALAQAAADGSVPGLDHGEGTAGLAARVGYADQAHLSRECLRLSGLTPGQLLGGDTRRCAAGHDHGASYRPFLSLGGHALPIR